MIELLVVIAIATIGVVYTSSTGEAESTAMADKSAKDALDEAEGQSGIGILGIDVVARKMRQVVGLRDGAVSADTLAEYRADVEEDIDQDQWFDEDFAEGDLVAADDQDDDWDEVDWDEEAELAAAADEDWGDGPEASVDHDADHAILRGVMSVTADEGWEETDCDRAERWLQDAADDAATAAAAAPTPASPARAAAPAPTGIDTSDAPIVDEFDPTQDQILIGYRPGEAGNGRIGIMEDPLRPGCAAVTLGGRCVAVVLGGYGKVRAHHIDLVCEDPEDDLAA